MRHNEQVTKGVGNLYRPVWSINRFYLKCLRCQEQWGVSVKW